MNGARWPGNRSISKGRVGGLAPAAVWKSWGDSTPFHVAWRLKRIQLVLFLLPLNWHWNPFFAWTQIPFFLFCNQFLFILAPILIFSWKLGKLLVKGFFRISEYEMQGNCITLQRSVSSRGLLVAQNTVVPSRSLNEFGRSYPLMVDRGAILIWEKLFLEVKQQSFLSQSYGNSVYVTQRPKPGEKRSTTTASVNDPRNLFLLKSPGLDRNQWNEWPTLPLGSGCHFLPVYSRGHCPTFPLEMTSS